ncbi:pyridoxal phosphate-dependent aminotransferase [Leucobacter japonicus]|uniref:pyridoxal phosphate-dependent aminotransferase n=1 Tax=Leucobacter japonicus TaxID=1461259 RepID=UPI0006A794AF|nr:pyridoxal phosphate-dependent aminotransferase [Leucobacter japonicus]
MTALQRRTASRMAEIAPSPIRAIFDRAAELEASGRKIFHFEIGRPDFDTPQVAKAAASASLDRGEVHYSANPGTAELRGEIATYLADRRGTRYDPNGEVLVTIGANEAVFLSFMAYCGAGDEIVMLTPAWAHYEACAKLVGATPVAVPLDAANGYRFDAEALRAAITERTAMVVICTPNNPTGGVLTGEDISAIEDMLSGTDIVLLSDEIYADLVYGDAVHESPAARDSLRERTLVVGGFAKAFAMDGWRLGWLAGPRELVTPALRVRQYTTVCAPTFLQPGAAAALRDARDEAEQMRRSFETRRAAGLEILRAIPGIRVADPDGAFYFYVSYDAGTAEPAQQLAMRLLEDHGVAVVPGTAFDPEHGAHSFRISYACDIDDLREGLARIGTAFSQQ